MKSLALKVLKLIAKFFLGKGLIDKYFPYLLTIFARVYGWVQRNKISQISIPLNCKLKVFAKDLGVGLPLLLKGEFEPRQTDLFLKNLKLGNVVLDIGANVGYYTILAAKKVGRNGKVFAFEPDKESVKLLLQNVKLNGRKNVTVVQKAVADENKKVKFFSEKYNKGESSLSFNKKYSYEIWAISLDRYMKDKNIDVVKVDIEGAEINALLGAKETFSKLKKLKLFIEYNPSSIKRFGEEPKRLIDLVRKMRFRVISVIDESQGTVFPYSPANLKKVMNHTTYCTLFCIKDRFAKN